MINRQQLLTDLQKFLQRIEADLLERSESTEVPEVPAALHAEYEKASNAERTAQNYEDWRTDTITQAAAAWVLSCVFVRFLEDNSLIDPPKIAGPGDRLARARDEHELYFRSHPQHTDREYLLSIFSELTKLPGTRDIFGEHNAINDLPNWLSGDAAGELLNFFQKIDASTGVLVHDFADPNWDTRFLGDLYQDLSEAARKKFALLQTPDFVEEFILDRTLDPAIDEFGLVPIEIGSPRPDSGRGVGGEGPSRFKMIDPACGSGHFLLGAFRRIVDRWEKCDPEAKCRVVVQRALDSIYGVDINPFAVAIARFRLLLAALKECGVMRLSDAPGFRVHVACGDSLLHGENRTSTGQALMDFADGATDEELYSHAYPGEDLQTVHALLKPNSYHCVVGNPPYIVPKDRKLNDWYRKRFSACHMKYSLAVPFMQLIFNLAIRSVPCSVSSVQPEGKTENRKLKTENSSAAGFTGQITANSFMKREFGKKLIESFFPTVDLTHVIDTSGAYIPGHGTPTTVLFGRHRPPVANTLRTVMGIRGEPSTPDDPAQGLVWSSMVALVDQPGKQSEFVSVGDSERALFHKHPWSIGGGGASGLKELLEENTTETLSARSEVIGITAVTGEDDLYMQPFESLRRDNVEKTRPLIVGDVIRDWVVAKCESSIWLYKEDLSLIPLQVLPVTANLLWRYRAAISRRRRFGTPMIERGLKWYEWQELYVDKLLTPLTITFAEVATHNHFVLDRGGKVFKQTAPVIKLPKDATEDDHLALLGLLNSSTACFWMKQVAHNKGDSTDQHGARTIGDPAFNTYAFNGTLIGKLPLPEGRPLATTQHLDQLAQQLTSLSPSLVLNGGAVIVQNGGAVIVRNGGAVIVRNGGAVVLDSQGCKPLVGNPTPNVESRSDGIGHGDNATAPPFNARGRDATWGLHPRLSNAIAPRLNAARSNSESIRQQMVAGQENLDWECYKLYGLIEQDLIETQSHGEHRETSNSVPSLSPWCPIHPGQRAFEIVLARKIAAGETQSTWFERHGSTPITKLPSDWPEDYKKLVERRIELIENDPNIRLIEQPEYKRRWNTEAWESQLERALREWLLLRMETYFDFDGRMKESIQCSVFSVQSEQETENRKLKTENSPPLASIQLVSIAKLADVASKDAQFLEVAELYRDDPAFDVQALVEELVLAESVPHLPILRYKDSGLRKRVEWEKTWDLQRAEDKASVQCSVFSVQSEEKTENRKLKAENSIPVPPKYISADFISTGGARYWSLRGKLDVSKERWISFPHCEGPDGTLVICWAGYDHLQQAQAISAYYVRVQTEFGGSDDPRLIPLLASLIELLPWLKQWHNEPNANFDGLRMGDYFDGFVNEEARNMGKTLQEIKAWVPPKKVVKAKLTKGKKRSVQAEVEADE